MATSNPLAAPAANTSKRDFLIALEATAQQKWAQGKLFETNSPYTDGSEVVPSENFSEDAARVRAERPKWFGTFPYPYMNGSLHLGHAFTISKIEFAAGFERMRGKRVLWPVGFHCTGMPIKSASDKIIREMEMFGDNFENYVEGETAAVATVAATSSDPAKAKKGKLAAKSTGLTYQFQIMESIGVPREDIKKFADTAHWLEYFPPIAQSDITAFGGRVDWRRSFVTTPANPYYDSFVRWQMNKLRALGYIKFGKRYTIYSAKDGQPCMDHDRQSGEGVGPQEYTAIKMPVVSWGAAAARVQELVGDRQVVMVAATLRPETMYGQTACFVGPTITYGLYPSRATPLSPEVLYLITPRSARNMAFQGLLREEDKLEGFVGEVKGSELVGTKVGAPNAVHKEVWVLPMESVLATKGTGVVTCVPSDSPDDYITSLDLAKKAEYYKIDPSWIAFDPVPVLSTPTYGDLTAPALVDKFKIQSPKDVKQLAEAKEIAYKEGFYQGTMVIGEYKGLKVEEAKTKVREDMIKGEVAFAYSEPENLVMSRSADECIVALCDQWYLDYGETGWRIKAELLLSRMHTYNQETRNGFEQTLGWLRQWACARSYGLGSKLPWDPQFLVESLSDSTIYMAYYTVAHLLHGPPIDGSVVGPLGIKHSEMTDEIWDYIFANGKFPDASSIPLAKVNTLRSEFSYFYPLDIRSSGKDLIPNHLSFCIYVHSALFAEEHWPVSMRANGHLMLNGEKMSKSTGNSLTLKDSLEKFGADATRVTLADAGDSIEDANFEEATANAAILRLRTLIDWCEETMASPELMRKGPADQLWDSIFENELNLAVDMTYEAYSKSLYKEALKHGFYTLLAARDSYRDATSHVGGMHPDLVERFIRYQALLLTPIAPHVAEHLWSSILKETTSVQNAQWPKTTGKVDPIVIDQALYIKATLKTIRDAEAGYVKKKAKGKGGSGFDVTKEKAINIYVSTTFPHWQEPCVQLVRDSWTAENGVDDAAVKRGLAERGLGKEKRSMPFMANFKRIILELGADAAFNRTPSFDEAQLLEVAMPYLRRTLGIEHVQVVLVENAQAGSLGYDMVPVEKAEPGSPGIVFYNPV